MAAVSRPTRDGANRNRSVLTSTVTSETLFRDLGGDAVPRPGHESQLARGVAGTPFEELVSDVSELVAH